MTRYFAGIDVGSSATKVVLLDPDSRMVAKALIPSGMDFEDASEKGFEQCLDEVGARKEDVAKVVSSGYGRKNVPFADSSKTEIACHARGAHFRFPRALTVVDIGGQDNKIIKIGDDGSRLDFKMNRKCAAGTGAFLEEIARRMGVGVEEMEPLARQSTEHVEIGSFCTVFSATEILALVRRGVKTRDIAKGAFRSVVKRVVEMDSLAGTVVATGGVVAHNPIVVELMSETIGHQVLTTDEPQFSGALGAALYAVDEGRREE